MVLPGVSPEFKVIHEAFSSVFTDIIKDYCLLSLISVPPPVGKLLVGVWIVICSLASLTSTRFTPIPKACLWCRSWRDYLMILLNLLEVTVVADQYCGIDLIELTSLCVASDLVPVCLASWV